MSQEPMIIENIPMKEILCDHDFNCRGAVAPIDVVDLAKSIEESGLLQPITIQPWENYPGKKYRVVTGHRRYVAHIVLKREMIPTIIKTGLTEVQAKTLNLIENLKRKDLNIMQEARAISWYKKQGFTQEETAAITGQSRGWTQVRFMVLDFPEDVQVEIAAGFINQTQIRDLHGLPPDKLILAIKDIKMRREKGDKSPVVYKAPKKKGTTKRERGRLEIQELLETIYDVLGPSFATRALAWASGEISDFDIQIEIRDEAAKIGKKYTVPRELSTW